MFDTLTPAERLILRGKLHSGSRKFATAGHCLAGVSRLFDPLSAENYILWQQSAQFYEAMREMHGLRAELATR